MLFQLFDKLKGLHGPEFLSRKCTAIAGDVSELGLALSEEDRLRLTRSVQFIYHCAATIRFDEPLKHAVLLNTRGTKLMLDLAKECTKLEVSVFNPFLHDFFRIA